MIDAHHHLWQISRSECIWPTQAERAIHRDHDAPEYRALASAAGIRASILVQSQESRDDTLWLLSIAEREPLIAGVVGWTDLSTPAAAADVAALAVHPGLVGLRPMVQDRPADWYDDPSIAAGIGAMVRHGLRLDALVRVPHLAALERFARRQPELAIVIDHAAKPRIGDAHGFDAWHAAIAPLADRPNLSCKLSGLLNECPIDRRSPEVLAPYVSAMLALFGPERLMWGSDWPVLNLASDYVTWLEMAESLVPSSAHRAVFESSACDFYGLGAQASAS